MHIYATNIRLTQVPDSRNWLSLGDYEEWQHSFFGRGREWKTQPAGSLPPGVTANAKWGKDFVIEYIDIDLPLPQGKINRELRNAIYVLTQMAEMNVEVSQQTILKDVYEGLHGVHVDLSLVVQADPNSEQEE